MANKVICHYGIKGMKWRNLKSVSPDDTKKTDYSTFDHHKVQRGIDYPTEGMTPEEERAYRRNHSLFNDPWRLSPNRKPDRMPKKPELKTKDKSIETPSMPKSRFRSEQSMLRRPKLEKPFQDHESNIPGGNRSSAETKKKQTIIFVGCLKGESNILRCLKMTQRSLSIVS